MRIVRIINGEDGNDTLTNYAPDSALRGGDGDDYLIVNGGTSVLGGDGDDTIDYKCTAINTQC